jgi:general secretion pathway protein I
VNRNGFTLLEVLVATAIMAIAITALLSNLSVSMRTAGRLTDYDRAAMIARARMDELLLDQKLPHGTEFEGLLDPARTGWTRSGWRGVVRVFERPPHSGIGTPALERVNLEIWWDTMQGRRTFTLEAFRRGAIRPEDGDAVQ